MSQAIAMFAFLFILAASFVVLFGNILVGVCLAVIGLLLFKWALVLKKKGQ